MPTSNAIAGPSTYDYTEGASAIDISDAVSNSRRARRDSQHSLAYDDGVGSMFDGPGHTAIPSSVSRMSHPRSLSRHKSDGSQQPPGRRRRRSDASYATEGDATGDNEEDIAGETSPLRGRRSSPARTSVFRGFAHLFGHAGGETPSRRRPSFSQRSSASSRRWGRRSDAGSEVVESEDEDGDDRWGYSSGEEDEASEDEDIVRSPSPIASEYGSYPPSISNSVSLPLLSNDQFFGDDTRIEVDLEPLEDPPPEGPPSRQILHLSDEDMVVRFVGHEVVMWRQWIWRLACVLSAGILGLLGHWFPRLWLRWVTKEYAFSQLENGFVVVETALRDMALFPVQKLHYPYHSSTVFSGPLIDAKAKTNGNGNGIHDDGQVLNTLLVVDYRYARFALDPRSGLFQLVKDWRDPLWTGVQSVRDGLQESVRQQRQTLFGLNVIDIEGKSTLSLMVDEVIHPFYVFQIASIVLWCLDNYYYYAFCIALMSIISIATTLIETKKTIKRMREMSRFSCPVSVFVDGLWLERDSADLVPGDVVNLTDPPLVLLPADMFLLSGDAIVNESMLTGESVPVSKIPVHDEELARWRETRDVGGDLSKGFLYSGTKVVRIRKAVGASDNMGERPALGLVVRAGFNTTKGALVRSMLFPKPMGFKFYRDSIRFIMVLSGIAGLGFCASAVRFVHLGVPWHTILIRALDLITIVVPPALPATLSIGTSFALNRLRKAGIFCIAPTRINVAGKINVCCFDKTGTLTEDGLDILGVRGLDRSGRRFGELIEDVHDVPMGRDRATFLHALATCHQLKVVDGGIIGDPLDVKMFEFTRWTIEEGSVAGTGKIKGRTAGADTRPAALVQTIVRPPGSAQFRLEDALKGSAKHAHFLEFGVIRTFEFVSQLRRMSVVVKRLKSTSMEVYVKGAPEVMTDICDRDSFPDDYDDLLSYYTKRGYRVIAIAGKSIEGITWLKAQRMKREQAEFGLRFLGLIIFENKLKPGTAPAIQALRAAHLVCRMITGDNPLTAVSVARECNMITHTAPVFAPSFIQGNATTLRSKLRWACMDDPQWELDDYSLRPMTPPAHHSLEADIMDFQDYAIVITGDVFRWMVNNAPLETLQRMFSKTQIFSRMSPDEKNEVVERLQALGYTVLMCGDGANDCAALKAADVGLSLSEAEASVAAPFTSRTPDIGCVLEVIREGRAALVTSFSCFKYMALYSLIQFTTITLLYSFASSLGDFQFLYIDLFIIIPVAVTMGRTLPFPRIHPKRPTASLVSKGVLTSLFGQIILTSAVQFWAFLWIRRQPWYTPIVSSPREGDGDQLNARNYENSGLFLVSCFQYILVAAVFSIGPPYRKPMWTNGWLIFSLVLLTLFNAVVLLAPPQILADVLELMPLPSSARTTLLTCVVVNVVASLAFERWVVPLISQVVGDALNTQKTRVKDGKGYKAIETR